MMHIISLSLASFLLIKFCAHRSASAFITPSSTSSYTQSNLVQYSNILDTNSMIKEDTTTRRRHANTILLASKKNVPKMPTLTNKPQTTTNTIVLMDVENIRGATSFRISHEALLSRIKLWREDRLSMGLSSSSVSRSGEYRNEAYLEPLLWVCDHGMTPSIHHFSSSSSSTSVGEDVQMPHNFGAVFAGPHGRTADDVIVDLVNIRCGGKRMKYDDDEEVVDKSVIEPLVESNSRNSTIVITADARLITRCQQARRKSNSLSDVIFVEPASLLQQLERYRINANEEESLFGKNAWSLTVTPPPSRRYNKPLDSDKRVDGKTNSMTSFKDSSIALQQHAKFQQRFQGKKDESIEDKEEPGTNDEEEEDDTAIQSIKQDNDASLAAQLKTEQIRRQMLLSDAYYLARPHKNVRGRRAHTTSAAVHAQYKNRNISKKQQKKLYAKRFGNKRKEDMEAAASKRKELAAKLQLNLQQISPDSSSYDSVSNIEDGDEDMLIKSMRLLEKLLGKFEQERLQRSSNEIDSNGMTDTSIGDASTLLGLERTAGKVGINEKWDPLGSTLNVPLRKDTQSNESLPPLRIVVISDTHGFEGALARFAENSSAEGGQTSKLHTDDYLFPHADVLLHCGDFAASGSRKTQRQAARRLDDFLARQSHIPEKIVIQGNHDPNSPANVLFPSSKALYVRSSSTLKINGVSFTLEPYSRRMAFRSIRKRSTTTYAMSSLPDCDILVTHEPPKGCLDLTYHGFSAGSMYLRELVEHTEHKPRLWLCGHIHESRGVSTRNFRASEGADKENDEDSSTIVINASNANSGRANRLVSGAVLVEIERNPTNGGDESAQDTLMSSKVDYTSGEITESINGSDDLASLGGDLEVYVTRPGVRRRKGVPQSVRQQMKGARAALMSNE